MSDLRKKLIRLAHDQPELREHVLPLLKVSNEEDDASEFAAMVKKKYRGVKFNPKTGQGSANLGGVKITWGLSGNDSAVVVMTEGLGPLKGSPEDVWKVLEAIKKALNRL